MNDYHNRPQMPSADLRGIHSSALKQKNCVFATVVDVQCLVGLACDVKAKTLAHNAMPSVTKALVHLFFDSLAS